MCLFASEAQQPHFRHSPARQCPTSLPVGGQRLHHFLYRLPGTTALAGGGCLPSLLLVSCVKLYKHTTRNYHWTLHFTACPMHAPLPSSLHTLHLQWAFAAPAIVYLVAVHLHQPFASLLQSKQRLKVRCRQGLRNKNLAKRKTKQKCS